MKQIIGLWSCYLCYFCSLSDTKKLIILSAIAERKIEGWPCLLLTTSVRWQLYHVEVLQYLSWEPNHKQYVEMYLQELRAVILRTGCWCLKPGKLWCFISLYYVRRSNVVFICNAFVDDFFLFSTSLSIPVFKLYLLGMLYTIFLSFYLIRDDCEVLNIIYMHVVYLHLDGYSNSYSRELALFFCWIRKTYS